MKKCAFPGPLSALARASAVFLLACSHGGLQAQTSSVAPATSPALSGVVVTATRTPTRADALVSDLVVVDRAAIEASTARTLPELLARQAGLQFTANGGAGKTSGVFIRGAEARHTLLLIDGVRYGSATAGIPAWDALPLDMIERIEVLKGPASALYGSDGVGGVVQIFTRKGRQGFHPQAAVTVGAKGYREVSAGVAGGAGAWTWALGADRKRERGDSSTNARVAFNNFNADTDGFRQTALNASAALALDAGWRADAGLIASDGKSQFDDGAGRDALSDLRSRVWNLGIKGPVRPGWDTELRLSQSADTNNAVLAAFPGDFKTTQDEWLWQNTVASPVGTWVVGAEHRVQKVSGTTAYTQTQRTIRGLFAGLNGEAGAHSWQANVRRDSNTQFGGASTAFAGYGYRISPAWRAQVSHGTSFVAPSFNQLYFPGFNNPLLQPERGRNTDLGLTWAADGHEVKLVRYDNKIRGYITNTTLPANIPQSRITGWTLGWQGKVGPVAVRASHDALNPRNTANDRQLPRRARHQTTLGADLSLGTWRVGGSLLSVGQRFDDAANAQPLPAYTTLDLHADVPLAAGWSLQGKVNNLTNRSYETAWGYNQPGRALYLTLRWQPK